MRMAERSPSSVPGQHADGVDDHLDLVLGGDAGRRHGYDLRAAVDGDRRGAARATVAVAHRDGDHGPGERPGRRDLEEGAGLGGQAGLHPLLVERHEVAHRLAVGAGPHVADQQVDGLADERRLHQAHDDQVGRDDLQERGSVVTLAAVVTVTSRNPAGTLPGTWTVTDVSVASFPATGGRTP